MPDFAQQLEDLITDSRHWPMRHEVPVLEEVQMWAGFREADKETIKPAGWATDDDPNREYVVDPLAGRISGAFADLIFGDDPTFTAASEGDQETLDGLIEENDLPSELQRAEGICCSEGEVWWRIYVDREAYLFPTIEWLSRDCVIPLYRGRRLLACAFVSELDPPPTQEENSKVRWRHVEIQTFDVTRNLLFRQTTQSQGIGEAVELTEHPDTDGVLEQWSHGLGMLAGRIVNEIGRDPSLGVSQYTGVKDLLLTLNEAVTIGQENARLTAKQKVIVPQRYLDRHGKLPTGAEVIVATEVDADPDKPAQGFAQIEWSFDAGALIQWIEWLIDTILTNCRVAPQFIGRHTESAQTGPALRARLLDTVLAANGKGRYWDDELPVILTAAQQVDALAKESGGFGNQWNSPAEPPAIERSDVLPEDRQSDVLTHSTAVGGLIESRETAIEELHPDWTEERRREEMRRIGAENALPGIEEPPET